MDSMEPEHVGRGAATEERERNGGGREERRDVVTDKSSLSSAIATRFWIFLSPVAIDSARSARPTFLRTHAPLPQAVLPWIMAHYVGKVSSEKDAWALAGELRKSQAEHLSTVSSRSASGPLHPPTHLSSSQGAPAESQSDGRGHRVKMLSCVTGCDERVNDERRLCITRSIDAYTLVSTQNPHERFLRGSLPATPILRAAGPIRPCVAQAHTLPKPSSGVDGGPMAFRVGRKTRTRAGECSGRRWGSVAEAIDQARRSKGIETFSAYPGTVHGGTEVDRLRIIGYATPLPAGTSTIDESRTPGNRRWASSLREDRKNGKEHDPRQSGPPHTHVYSLHHAPAIDEPLVLPPSTGVLHAVFPRGLFSPVGMLTIVHY
uniref:Uncharacterized protein n=1 Tax=Mycena chlorophos TaxID=658473 RepID=A0ABQ0LH75_MYCCL|nr:predicted protein [Mycena chlorophos]